MVSAITISGTATTVLWKNWRFGKSAGGHHGPLRLDNSKHGSTENNPNRQNLCGLSKTVTGLLHQSNTGVPGFTAWAGAAA
jgi:hypothetical protein